MNDCIKQIQILPGEQMRQTSLDFDPHSREVLLTRSNQEVTEKADTSQKPKRPTTYDRSYEPLTTTAFHSVFCNFWGLIAEAATHRIAMKTNDPRPLNLEPSKPGSRMKKVSSLYGIAVLSETVFDFLRLIVFPQKNNQAWQGSGQSTSLKNRFFSFSSRMTKRKGGASPCDPRMNLKEML